MPVFHNPQIKSEYPNNPNFKSNLLPRFDPSATRYVVPIVVAIAVPLGIILCVTIYLILYPSRRPTGTRRNNGDRPPRKLRKLRKRRSIKPRNQISDFHHNQDNDEPEDFDDNSVNENNNIPGDINMSLLSTSHSTITRVESNTSTISETVPLMRGSTAISRDSSPLPDIERPARTELEELEDRVQRLESRLTAVTLPPLSLLDSAEPSSQNRNTRIQESPLEEQLPAYTSRPASFAVPRGVTSSGWYIVR